MHPNSQLFLISGCQRAAVVIGILLQRRKLNGLRTGFDDKIDTRFDAFQQAMNSRFDAAEEALLRVEGVLDARLNRLEEERRR